jgi:hypothetical protein
VPCLQPLTTLQGIKCKHCGLYEHDTWNPDDVFGQWELCPLDFTFGSDGRYFRFKEGEFNLTLSCSSCSKLVLLPQFPYNYKAIYSIFIQKNY